MGLIATLFGPTLTSIGDREWFADHGRRHHRFRPALAGELEGFAYLVHRDGRRFAWAANGPAAFELGADEAVCAIVWRALAAVNYPLEETATTEAAAV